MARKKFSIKHLGLTLGILSFYLVLFSMPTSKEGIIMVPPQEPVKPIKTIVHDTFSELLLKDEIKKLEIKFPEIVYAQARLETGNFKSNYFKKQNNLFGFRMKKHYMFFKDWRECVLYYSVWQKKYYKQGEDYFEFLTRIHYAEADSIYKERVLSCIKYK